MVILSNSSASCGVEQLPPTFHEWRCASKRLGILPLIGVAGSRGKSTVVRLLDAAFAAAGLRSATWTNRGVEVGGRHQQGELSGWTRALGHLAEGSTDVAIQELDWATVNAVGLPASTYPIMAITNLCGNSDTCLADGQTRHALRAVPAVVNAAHTNGVLLLNGDDFQLVAPQTYLGNRTLLTALSGDSPLIRTRLDAGLVSLWVEDGAIVVGDGLAVPSPILEIASVPLTLGGEATFEVSNVLTAVAIALASGLDADSVRRGIVGFKAWPSLLPGSFNVHDVSGSRVIVDRIGAPWFLRPILRAVNAGGRANMVTIVGPLDGMSEDTAFEYGRLLGHYRGAVILHSVDGEARVDAFRRGLTVNTVPPLMIRLPTERRALNRGLTTLKPGSVLLILTNDPATANRAITRLAIAL